MDTAVRSSATLQHYVAVLRRRRWTILACILIVPAAAFVFTSREQKLYSASAEVLINQQSLATSLTGVASPSNNTSPDRVAQTQAEVAQVPAVAARVLRALRLTGWTPQDLLAETSVTAQPDADLLVFQVTDPNPSLVSKLATSYAHEFTIYRRHLDTIAIIAARQGLEARTKQLSRAGDTSSTLYQSLVERDQQLATMQALETSYFVIRGAEGASQIGPHPTRNTVLGLVIGIGLGIALALLLENFDTRVRSAEEVVERIGLPLLARLPAPRKAFRNEDALVMVRDPTGSDAEPFRLLRTNLEFTILDRDVRTLMITSAVAREGKSTTIANLAIALARAGRRVTLVDLDLRRPYIDRFFELGDRPGLTNVVLGQRVLEDAVVRIPLVDQTEGNRGTAGANGNGAGPKVGGWLDVLPSGPLPPDPGVFVGTEALRLALDRVAERSDIVLIDAPPLLNVGDALTLSAHVDAMLLVCRVNVLRRPMLGELHRLIASTPATVLGFALTGAGEADGYGYGNYGYYHEYGARRERSAGSPAGQR